MKTASVNSPSPYESQVNGPNRKVPAWILSCAIHVLVLLALVLLATKFQNGAASEDSRSGGIVLVEVTSEETTEYLSEGETSESSSAATSEQSPPPLPSDDELPPDLPGVASSPAEITGIGEDLAEAFPGADSLLEGNGTAVDIGGKVTTEVFGVKGTGSSFIYVFDRSDSMEGYERRPLLAAKQALKTSLDSLGANHQFQIIFYNNATRVLNIGGQTKMFFAEDDNKEAGRRFVDSIQGDGGTDHLTALKYALSLGPDVIFMLTDAEGGFTPAELGAVSDWNRSAAIINAVEFGVGSKAALADRSLEQLARESGGQYTYKNILTLRVDQ